MTFHASSPRNAYRGAFGNRDEWIQTAMRRTLRAVSDFGLDVKLVSYSWPSRMLLNLAQEFG
jgi:hypothetical protein